MILKPNINISQCQSDLEKNGFCLLSLELSDQLKDLVKSENYHELDSSFTKLLSPSGALFELLQKFCAVVEIEHIISLRDAQNEWEEDGIWHDDGSRILAFSLSLTLEEVFGGVLEIREKIEGKISSKLETPAFGTIIIFKTGQDNYEHKINQVTKGKRLIIAGWCYPSKSI